MYLELTAKKPSSLQKKLPSEFKYTLKSYYDNQEQQVIEDRRSIKNDFEDVSSSSSFCSSISYVSSAKSHISNKADHVLMGLEYTQNGGYIIFNRDPFVYFLDTEFYNKHIVDVGNIGFLRELGLIKDLIFFAEEYLNRLPVYSVRRQDIIDLLGILFDLVDNNEILTSGSEFGSSEEEIFSLINFVEENRTDNFKKVFIKQRQFQVL